MLVIGLTGGSGAGKSTVSDCFRERGFAVCDADRLYASMIDAPSPCCEAIAAVFGTSVLSEHGAVDRRALRAVVFTDPAALALLNKTVHPLVLTAIGEQLALWRARGDALCILDAPQLFESGAERLCSLTVGVIASRDVRIDRIMLRDGIARADAERRVDAQLSDAYFRARCDYIIENSGSTEDLIRCCDSFLVRFGLTEER